MKRARVAKRYAKALFDATLEARLIEPVEKDLMNIGQSLAGSPDLRRMIASPVVPRSRKKATFKALFEKGAQPLTYHFLLLLIDKNREDILEDAIADFNDLLDRHRGISRGDLFSVVPLTGAQRQSISDQLDKLTGTKVSLTERHDEAQLGGFVVKIQDTVYDASLRNQLIKLRQNLIES